MPNVPRPLPGTDITADTLSCYLCPLFTTEGNGITCIQMLFVIAGLMRSRKSARVLGGGAVYALYSLCVCLEPALGSFPHGGCGTVSAPSNLCQEGVVQECQAVIMVPCLSPSRLVVSTPAGLCGEPHDVSVLGELKERQGGGREGEVTPWRVGGGGEEGLVWGS